MCTVSGILLSVQEWIRDFAFFQFNQHELLSMIFCDFYNPFDPWERRSMFFVKHRCP